jgi:hypothetical protein
VGGPSCIPRWAAARYPHALLTQHMLLGSAPRSQLSVLTCLTPSHRSLILFLVIFAVQNYVKSLKNVSYACSSITSQVGTSNPRASRSREHLLPSPPVPPIISLCFADITRSWANSSDVAMTTRTVRRGFTLQSKVCVCVRRSAPSLPFHLTSLPQVSHHPPISAFYYVSPANKLAIVGELRPKSRFLGNSVSTVMEGESRITLMGRPEDSGKSIAYSSLPLPRPHTKPKTRAD